MNSPKERAGEDFSSIQKWLKNLPSIGSLERLGGSLEDTSVGTSKRLKNSRETLNQSTKAALKDDMANLAAGKSDVSEPKPLTPKQSLGLESEKRDISGPTTAAPLINIYPQSASQGIPQITQSPSATLKKGGRLQEVASQQSPENTTMGSVISIQGLHTSSYSIAVSDDNTGYGSLTPAASSSPNLAARHLTNLGSKLIHSTNHTESASVFDKKHQLRTELVGFDRARNSSTSEFGSAESNPHTRLSVNSASTRGRKITAKDINNQVNSSREGINLIGSKNSDDPNRRPTASFDDGLARKSSLTGADFKRGILNTSNRRSSLAKEVQPITNTKADIMGSESSSLEQVQSAQGSENSLQQSDFDNNSSSVSHRPQRDSYSAPYHQISDTNGSKVKTSESSIDVGESPSTDSLVQNSFVRKLKRGSLEFRNDRLARPTDSLSSQANTSGDGLSISESREEHVNSSNDMLSLDSYSKSMSSVDGASIASSSGEPSSLSNASQKGKKRITAAMLNVLKGEGGGIKSDVGRKSLSTDEGMEKSISLSSTDNSRGNSKTSVDSMLLRVGNSSSSLEMPRAFSGSVNASSLGLDDLRKEFLSGPNLHQLTKPGDFAPPPGHKPRNGTLKSILKQLEITSPKTIAATSLLGAPQPAVVDHSSDSLDDPSNASRTKIKWDKTRIYTFEPGEDENGKVRGSLSKAKKRDLMRV